MADEVRESLAWVFDLLDEDGSGFIEQSEGLMTAKYMGASDNGAFWEKMKADMDTDGDGKISKEEYVMWMAVNTFKEDRKGVLEFRAEIDAKVTQARGMQAMNSARGGGGAAARQTVVMSKRASACLEPSTFGALMPRCSTAPLLHCPCSPSTRSPGGRTIDARLRSPGCTRCRMGGKPHTAADRRDGSEEGAGVFSARDVLVVLGPRAL
jgi:hypothetical protein